MSEAKLRERIEYLEAENANLRTQLRQEPAVNFIGVARQALGIAPAPCRLLWQLMDGRTKSRDALFQSLFSDRADPPDVKIIDVQLSHVRRGLAVHGVELINVHNVGYRMTPEGIAKVRAILGIEAQP